MPATPKRVAIVATVYRHWSHVDVLAGKILEGFLYDGGEKPALEVASMFVDQIPANDLSRPMAKRFGYRVSPTIADALTLGTGKLAVDGVLIIGEHGIYPTNDVGQILYPRRRLLAEVCDVFEQAKRSVPVFHDKHLGPTWTDAKWMAERVRALHVPFLAGSSVPLTWRKPVVNLEKGAKLTHAFGMGYGPLEGYGFHALEMFQSMVERRSGGEVGVQAVQYLSGPDMWKPIDQDAPTRALFERTRKLVTGHAPGDIREITAKTTDAGLFVIEYRDGFRGIVMMPNGWVYEGDGGAFLFAGQLANQPEPLACQFWLQNYDPFAHFSYLLQAIEKLIHTGQPGYPFERTLLTSGILDGLMRSRHQQNRRIETPELAIRYQPTNYPFATDPIPPAVQRKKLIP
ncbi:hypothetical protein [Tuwongella immobilis]|uniref:Uncharacterized protein n=1 Tax=Tuwongella immobilis TaxID=692036 RepID=A0A6C2YMQ4_9BACT|nr:hypothetical protein [Tuwongella immobilis]VIP02601.1 Uncharacterized protein OS=Planctomyces maris DSM 8797 GN=PM8797T_24616 PE=4 SV=1 [Tuwongella immobilis]VTS01891.1 Uncharacterized protein OS=Planctomyces maris DSM 8797 GN=PM8797T_24616 PE=4 SV=1 [Tuwongella immobilis]